MSANKDEAQGAGHQEDVTGDAFAAPRRPIIGLPAKKADPGSENVAGERALEATAPAGTDVGDPQEAKVAPCVFGAEPPAGQSELPVQAFASTLQGSNDEKDVVAPLAVITLGTAIQQCSDLGGKSDAMMNEKWGNRSAPILAACLTLMAAFQNASTEERQKYRRTLKTKSGVTREPYEGNIPVIAVYLCVACSGKTRTKAQRKEWCRFATVVRVAARASVEPANAPKWLEKKTLKGILAEERALKTGKPAFRRPTVLQALKPFKHLAAALEAGSKYTDVARTELSKVDSLLADIMAKHGADLSLAPKGISHRTGYPHGGNGSAQEALSEATVANSDAGA